VRRHVERVLNDAEARETFAVYNEKEFIVQRFRSRAAQPLSGG